MPRYRLSRAAAEDIVAIYLESLGTFGAAQADRYHRGLEGALEFLADHPRAARVRDEITPPVRAFRYQAHMIVYDLGPEDIVTILGVRHGREDWISDPR